MWWHKDIFFSCFDHTRLFRKSLKFSKQRPTNVKQGFFFRGIIKQKIKMRIIIISAQLSAQRQKKTPNMFWMYFFQHNFFFRRLSITPSKVDLPWTLARQMVKLTLEVPPNYYDFNVPKSAVYQASVVGNTGKFSTPERFLWFHPGRPTRISIPIEDKMELSIDDGAKRIRQHDRDLRHGSKFAISDRLGICWNLSNNNAKASSSSFYLAPFPLHLPSRLLEGLCR